MVKRTIQVIRASGQAALRNGWAVIVLAATMTFFTGCASTTGPTMLVVESSEYHDAFDAAVEAARTRGMPAVHMDRRLGVIQTDAEIAGSLLEPWRMDNASIGQTLENTLALQRRRCRFEFTPVGFQPDYATQDDAEDLVGPDVFATGSPGHLTEFDGRLELRVRVYVERAYTPGTRRSTWSHRLTSRMIEVPEEPVDPYADGGGTRPLPARLWTPLGRDHAYERRLLADVHALMGSSVSVEDG